MFTKKQKIANELHEFVRYFTQIFKLIVVIFLSHKGGKMFELVSNYKPTGDQPEAIEYLAKRNKRRKKIPDSTRSNRLTEKLLQWQI